jgi:hypothetical protein
MEQRKKQIFAGIVITIISIVVLYFNLRLHEGSFGKLWPALVLLLGVILYIVYFTKRRRQNRLGIGFLATFVSVSSVPLFILTFTGPENFHYIWPGFILAIGCGLVTVYLYGARRKGTLFLAQLLMAIPLLIWIFFAMRSKFGLVIGVALLMIGVASMARGFIRDRAPSAEGREKDASAEGGAAGPDEERETS